MKCKTMLRKVITDATNLKLKDTLEYLRAEYNHTLWHTNHDLRES